MSSSVAQTLDRHLDSHKREVALWVLNLAVIAASNGSVTSTAIDSEKLTSMAGWYLYKVKTIPGADAKAPTAAYDITLTDGDGFDVCGGLLANRSATAVEVVQIAPSSGSYVANPKSGLTLNVANNSVDSAEITIVLTFVR